MNRNTRLWKIGLVIATSLLLSITGCTWTDDIWNESAETQSSESAFQMEPEPHQEDDVLGTLEDSGTYSPAFPAVQERIALAFPSTGLLSRDLDRVRDGNRIEWPEMNCLGEAVIFQESTVIPEELRIVEGGSIAVMYSPEEDQMLDAPTGIPRHLQGHPLPAVMIPPRSSLVMVRMEVEYEGSYNTQANHESYTHSGLRISYPQYGASNIIILESSFYPLGEFNSVAPYSSDSGWVYFIVPGIDLDQAQMWLEYIQGSNEDDMIFWTLAERP
ncbi:MAG: hypothetical protein U9N80_14640 [Chloroflexota bacterium]|nr:hypothetical protein [Chloroflexota bacterium]